MTVYRIERKSNQMILLFSVSSELICDICDSVLRRRRWCQGRQITTPTLHMKAMSVITSPQYWRVSAVSRSCFSPLIFRHVSWDLDLGHIVQRTWTSTPCLQRVGSVCLTIFFLLNQHPYLFAQPPTHKPITHPSSAQPPKHSRVPRTAQLFTRPSHCLSNLKCLVYIILLNSL